MFELAAAAMRSAERMVGGAIVTAARGPEQPVAFHPDNISDGNA